MKNKLLLLICCVVILICSGNYLPVSVRANPGSPALDVVILIDDSSGVDGPGRDGVGVRFTAVREVIDYLILSSQVNRSDVNIAVANFSGMVTNPITLRPVNPLINQMIKPDDVSQRATDFYSALDWAVNQLRPNFGAGRAASVILITDGRPGQEGYELYQPLEWEIYFDNLARQEFMTQFVENDVNFFVLGLGFDFSDVQPYWVDLVSEERVRHISSSDTLVQVMRSIIAEYSSLDMIQARELTPSGDALQIDPYVEYITFSFFVSDPSLVLSLSDPHGETIYPEVGSDGSHYRLFSIYEPLAGEWTILRQGNGEAKYWVDLRYPSVRPVLTADYHFTDHPITITASLLRNGLPIEAPELDLYASVVRPDGISSMPVQLLPGENGIFQGQYPDTDCPNVYEVSVTAYLNQEIYPIRQFSSSISLLPAPSYPTPSAFPTYTPYPTHTPSSTETSFLAFSTLPTTPTITQSVAPGIASTVNTVAITIGIFGITALGLIVAWFIQRLVENRAENRIIKEIVNDQDKDWDLTKAIKIQNDLIAIEEQGIRRKIIRALYTKALDNLKSPNPDTEFTHVLNSGRTKNQKYALAQVVIKLTLDELKLEYLHSYRKIFGWVEAFEWGIHNYRATEIEDDPLRSYYADVISSYLKILQLIDCGDPDQLHPLLGDLCDRLNAVQTHNRNDRVAVDYHNAYQYINNLYHHLNVNQATLFHDEPPQLTEYDALARVLKSIRDLIREEKRLEDVKVELEGQLYSYGLSYVDGISMQMLITMWLRVNKELGICC